jgi:hypothetical protein
MEIAVVKNAIGSLDELLSEAKQALWDVQREVFGISGNEAHARPREAMKESLEELCDVLLVVLEAADMRETRASLINKWRVFIDDKGLGHTNDYQQFQNCDSPALTFLERLIKGLRIAVGKAISSEEEWTLRRLEEILHNTSVLIYRRQNPPAGEDDLKKIMHDYLHACFHSDFRRKPAIGGILKDFKPDCGIASVGAAIEFKFIRTKENAGVAVTGIVEDANRYKGSKDWTRFYAVLYQAEPFVSENDFQNELRRIEATAWTAIVVNRPATPHGLPARRKPARWLGRRRQHVTH